MFPWTICLSVDKRANQRTIDRVLKQHGWHVDLFTCGEGKLFPNYLYNHIDEDFGKWSQHFNHTNCFKKIVQIAKDRKLDHFLFFEDDAQVNKRYEYTFMPQLAKVWGQFNRHVKNWDLFYLAGEFYGSPKYLVTNENDYAIMYSPAIWSLVATIINSSCYDKLLALEPSEKEGTDGLIMQEARKEKLATFCIAPNIFTSYLNYSYNENKYLDKSKYHYL